MCSETDLHSLAASSRNKQSKFDSMLSEKQTQGDAPPGFLPAFSLKPPLPTPPRMI
ncbi:MAG: hypothetical protein K2G11_06750 [Muribaculaceae bacterium]|nr:hypothetical protein [Muribaculaceae bacterium]